MYSLHLCWDNGKCSISIDLLRENSERIERKGERFYNCEWINHKEDLIVNLISISIINISSHKTTQINHGKENLYNKINNEKIFNLYYLLLHVRTYKYNYTTQKVLSYYTGFKS